MSNKFDLDKALAGAPIWVMSDKAWLFQSKSNPSRVFIEYEAGRHSLVSFTDLLTFVNEGKIRMWEEPTSVKLDLPKPLTIKEMEGEKFWGIMFSYSPMAFNSYLSVIFSEHYPNNILIFDKEDDAQAWIDILKKSGVNNASR